MSALRSLQPTEPPHSPYLPPCCHKCKEGTYIQVRCTVSKSQGWWREKTTTGDKHGERGGPFQSCCISSLWVRAWHTLSALETCSRCSLDEVGTVQIQSGPQIITVVGPSCPQFSNPQIQPIELRIKCFLKEEGKKKILESSKKQKLEFSAHRQLYI